MARFSEAQIAGRVTAADIGEASGLAGSRTHPNIVYTMNDGGSTPVLYAIDSTNGEVRARLLINNTLNIDWEDLATGPCDSSGQGYCIYIGDIGRRNRPVPADRIMRIREPETIANGTLEIESTLEYFWDVADCETLLVDPQGEVYLVSKIRGGKGYITHVPASGWGTGTRATVTSLARIRVPYTRLRQPVGGDISPNGQEILIRSREHVYYWRLAAGESYITALSTRSPLKMPKGDEPQGESVCWSSDGSSYYTMSEGYDQPLYYFVRQ